MIAGLCAFGLCVGLLNGLVVTVLKVPSIIATLGMMLSVGGLAMLWSGGAPRGELSVSFRLFGRFVIRDVPLFGTLPLAAIILLAAALLSSWLLHGTMYGARFFAVGDNPRAAELAGVPVRSTRIGAFAVSAVSAVTVGILLGGFAGVSVNAGNGLELQAIAACVIGGARLLGGRRHGRQGTTRQVRSAASDMQRQSAAQAATTGRTTMPNTTLRLLAAALALCAAAPALAQNFDDTAEYARQRALLSMKPNGPDGQPWAQWLGDGMVETAKYKKDGAPRVCFSNAGIFTPRRVVGFHDMEAEVEAQGAAIASFTVADAEGKDDKQISDIEAMLSGGNCDVLIVSPNTTAALTPVVEKACGQMPVIVFDRGVDTKCPVTFIQPVGGYGFGITSAEFMAYKLPKGAKVLAIRIVPGVDVLETRYSAARASSTRPASRSSARSSPAPTAPGPRQWSRTISAGARRSTASGWTRATLRRRLWRPSRTPVCPIQ